MAFTCPYFYNIPSCKPNIQNNSKNIHFSIRRNEKSEEKVNFAKSASKILEKCAIFQKKKKNVFMLEN